MLGDQKQQTAESANTAKQLGQHDTKHVAENRKATKHRKTQHFSGSAAAVAPALNEAGFRGASARTPRTTKGCCEGAGSCRHDPCVLGPRAPQPAMKGGKKAIWED